MKKHSLKRSSIAKKRDSIDTNKRELTRNTGHHHMDNPPSTTETDSSKSELQRVMAHLLRILREILTTVHEERVILDADLVRPIASIIKARQDLLDTFDTDSQHFTKFVSSLAGHPENHFSFAEGLEWLKGYLPAEDVELILLNEHLAYLTAEMQDETKSLLHTLECKSAYTSLRNPLIKKAPTHTHQLAIGVLEVEA